MAQKVLTVVLDDLDGEEIRDGAGEELTFTVGKTRYTLDLRSENVEKFHAAIAPFTRVAHRSSAIDRRRLTLAPRSTPSVSNAEVRRWAEENNIQVKDRGRLPQAVIEQYQQAKAS